MKYLILCLFSFAFFSMAGQSRFSIGAFFHETNLKEVNTDQFFGYTVRFSKEYVPKKCPLLFMGAGFGLDYKGGRNTYSTGYRLNTDFGVSTYCKENERLFLSAGLSAYSPIDKSGRFDDELVSMGTRFNGGFEVKKWSVGLVANYAFTARRERQVEFYIARRI